MERVVVSSRRARTSSGMSSGSRRRRVTSPPPPLLWPLPPPGLVDAEYMNTDPYPCKDCKGSLTPTSPTGPWKNKNRTSIFVVSQRLIDGDAKNRNRRSLSSTIISRFPRAVSILRENRQQLSRYFILRACAAEMIKKGGEDGLVSLNKIVESGEWARPTEKPHNICPGIRLAVPSGRKARPNRSQQRASY